MWRRAQARAVPVFIYTSTMDKAIIDITERKKQFFQRIKTETADLHRQTEHSRLSLALMSEGVTEEDYAAYLARMRDIVAYYENSVFSNLSEIIPDIEHRRKLHLLEADLAAYEEEVRPFSLPHSDSSTTLLGYMYVLEGSSLGGALIHKHLRSHIDVPGNFFNCYGNDLSARWKSFLDIIGTYGLDEKAAEEIIKGARIAFDKIHAHLSLA